MQDIPQETLSETTKAEQSAKVDLWEFDLPQVFRPCIRPSSFRSTPLHLSWISASL